MTSPQRPRAAATPTASPEGVTAERTDLIEQRLRQCADDPMWANHAEVSKLLLRYAADSLADYRGRAEAAESSLAGLNDPVAVRANILRGTIKIPDDLVWLHDTHGPVAAALAAQAQRRDEVVEALDAAAYYIDRLRTAYSGKPVRDLEEAGAAYYRLAGELRAALNTPEPK